MIGNVCAVKRDVCRILETPYPVDLLQFKVYVISSNTPLLSTEQLYSIKQEGENYYLFHLLTQLDFYIKISSSIEFWREGMDVVILNKNAMKVGTGRLIHKGIDMDKALTKEEILASGCVIKSKYQTQFDNASSTQLIPEEYLLKPSDSPALVTFYYDSRYLSVTRLNLSIYEIEEVEGSYSNLSEREIDKQISPLNQKSSAKSYIVCQIGDILKVEEKENKDYEYDHLIIGGIWDYNSTSNVELIKSNGTSSLSFEITQDCFATFSINSPRYKITASVPGGYTAPTDEGLVALLPDGYDFGFTLLANNESIPTYAKEGQEINLSMELANYPSDVSQENLFYISPIVTVTYLENGVGRSKHLSPGIFNATTTTSTCSFTMPAADCHITVKLKLIGDGADQFVEPTEGESGYALVVTGNIGLVIIGGYYRTIPAMVIALDKVNVSFTRKLGHSYTYSLYYTASGTTLKSGVILGDCIEVDVWNDLTLNILELETDCIYTSATGKLALDKNWDNDNPIIGHNYYDNRSYAIDTENPLLTSGINNTFRNKSVTQVTFNTTLDDFHIYKNAFKDCNILTTVSVNGPTSINIGSSAFENTTSLQKINGSENIIQLSEKSFKNSGLLEYNSNIEITNIPKYTFLDCDRLSNVSLHNSPLSSINERAFENCSNLKTISVPKCIKEIGVYAFSNSGIPAISTSTTPQLLAGCTFITDNGRTELSVIKEGVFKGCNNLKDIELPDSIEHLETLSFAECDNIQNFSSPGLKMIELGVFSSTWIEEVHNYNNLNPTSYSNIRQKNNTSGIYFDFPFWFDRPKDHYVLIKPDDSKSDCILYKRTFQVRAGDGKIKPGNDTTFRVVGIAEYGFSHKDRLDLIGVNGYTFDAPHVTTVGKYAFKDANVRNVVLSSDLSYLGEGAFYNCQHLSRVYGMQYWTINEIPNKAFYNCGGVLYGIGSIFDMSGQIADPEFYLPLTTKRIGDFAFYNCKLMMHINNLALCDIEEIGESAFENCFLNQSWRLMNGIRIAVKVVGITLSVIGAFFGVVGTGIAVPDWNFADEIGEFLKWGIDYTTKKYVGQGIGIAIGGAAGTALGTTAAVHVDYFNNGLTKENAKNLTVELLFPKVTKIGPNAFKGCTHLESITVNNKITEIPNGAFQGCGPLVHFGMVDDSFTIDSKTDLSLAKSNIKVIGNHAFDGTCIYKNDVIVNILLSKAELIGAYAFTTNSDAVLTESSIILPNNVKTIGLSALNPFMKVVCPILDFSEKHFIRPFESSRSDDYFPTVVIPEGAKSTAESIDWGNNRIELIEVPLNDNLWKALKIAGYTIPWLTD